MKPRIKVIKKDVNVRIYDNLLELYGSKKANQQYKFIMLNCELKSLNI